MAPRPLLVDCQGDDFRVDVLDAVAEMPDDTLEVQREQLRDWVFATTLGRLSLKSSVADVFSGVADQPLVRDDALAHVLRTPTGPTRVVTTKAGEVIVLVEAASQAEMNDALIEAVDEEALSLDRTPSHVTVYGYELEPKSATVHVCRLRSTDRASLESAAQGYRTATLTTPSDLERFLSGGVDLLGAECTPAGLHVAGRQRPRLARAPVTAEQVAALAARLGDSYVPLSQFGTSLAELAPAYRAELDENARIIDNALLSSTSSAGGRVDAKSAAVIRTIGIWKRMNRGVSTTELLESYFLQKRFDGNLGFSLDPKYTSSSAIAAIDELTAALPNAEKTAAVLKKWGNAAAAEAVDDVVAEDPDGLRTTDSELRRVRKRLQGTDDVNGVLEEPLASAHVGAHFASYLLSAVSNHSGRQCARYDGPLAGTAAGMTLFYTDLSVKFFARDWNEKSPEGTIEGFASVVNHTGSTSWCEGAERPSTRIWFGLRNEGYLKERSGGLRFAPVATRLFARGSVTGNEKEGETEPGPVYGRFIRWWDAHYTRIASWDPQYEALNQLIKWSAAAQVARLGSHPACDVLSKVNVSRTHRLDTWAASQPDLRWKDAVAQVSASERGSDRECLPLIVSKSFATCRGSGQLIGGVATASLEAVRAKPVRVASTPTGLGRIGASAEGLSLESNGVRIRRLPRSGGELKDVDLRAEPTKVDFGASVGTQGDQAGSNWAYHPQAPIRRVEKTVQVDAKELRVSTKYNGLAETGLRASDLDRATVRLSFTPGDTLKARRIGQKLATKLNRDGTSFTDAATSLAASHDEVLLLDDGRLTVRLPETDTRKVYAVMDSGGGNRGPPGHHGELIVGSPDGGPSEGNPYRGANHKPVRVWLLGEHDARAYIDAHGKTPIGGPDATIRMAQRHFVAALAKGDVPGAEAAIRSGAKLREDLGPMRVALERQRALDVRAGGDGSSLDRLSMMLSIEQRRTLLPAANEAVAIKTASDRVLVPASYSLQGNLPPPVHPRGAVIPPGQEYVSRVVAIPLNPSTKFNTLEGEAYVHRSGASSPGARTTDSVGPATRLFANTRSAVAVTRCSDTDRSRPRCHELLPPAARELLASLSRFRRVAACDADGDRELLAAPERACGQALDACDKDGDGMWTGDAEQACVEEVRAKYNSSSTAP